MMQLVNDQVQILNPPKDNLICDAAKVEEILGVPPERVIDVMALRGDAIDNIPGAPGIGDKGSVEIIKRFGTVEQALERAAEVERKTYRESLLNNRETILFSKSMATIDTNVPIELDVDAMRAGEPDVDALRALFTELEFTSLLKELLPVVEVSQTHYAEAKSAADIEGVLNAVSAGGALAVAVEQEEPAAAPEEEEKEEEVQDAQLSFIGGMGGTLGESMARPEVRARRIAISAAAGSALIAKLDSAGAAEKMRSVLTDPALPKAVHDYKAAIHALDPLGISLAGVRHDPMLYSYLLDPTYSSHRLADIALRRFNLKLAEELAESADITGRLAGALRSEVERAGLVKLYEEMDLPLVPVLVRMEQAGVKIDTAALSQMSSELEREIAAKAKEIYEVAGMEFNVGSPKQLGDVLFNRMNLPKPAKYGKGRTISTAVDVLEELAENHPIARMVLDYRQLTKLKSTYVDALPALINPASGRLHTTFGQTGTATGRLSSANPNLQNIPIRTELGRGIRAAFIAEPGHVLLTADYSQIELRLLAHLSHDSLLVEASRRGSAVGGLGYLMLGPAAQPHAIGWAAEPGRRGVEKLRRRCFGHRIQLCHRVTSGPAQQSGERAARGLECGAVGDVQERDLLVGGRQRPGRVHAGGPGVVSDPHEHGHGVQSGASAGAAHGSAIQSGLQDRPQGDGGEQQRHRHGQQAEPGELAKIVFVVAFGQQAPPQQGGEGARVGQVGADVHPDQHGEHGPRAHREAMTGDHWNQHQNGRQVVDHVGQRSGQHSDRQQRRERRSARDHPGDHGTEAVGHDCLDHHAEAEHEEQEGNARRPHQAGRSGLALGQAPGGEQACPGERRPGGAQPGERRDHEPGERGGHGDQREQRDRGAGGWLGPLRRHHGKVPAEEPAERQVLDPDRDDPRQRHQPGEMSEGDPGDRVREQVGQVLLSGRHVD